MRKLVAVRPIMLLLFACATPAQGLAASPQQSTGPRLAGPERTGEIHRDHGVALALVHSTAAGATRVFNGRNWYWNATLACWFLPDHDDNPPGPNGGPGTNFENPPGPAGGPGASPDRNRCH